MAENDGFRNHCYRSSVITPQSLFVITPASPSLRSYLVKQKHGISLKAVHSLIVTVLWKSPYFTAGTVYSFPLGAAQIFHRVNQ
jgi:hypothetical protein